MSKTLADLFDEVADLHPEHVDGDDRKQFYKDVKDLMLELIGEDQDFAKYIVDNEYNIIDDKQLLMFAHARVSFENSFREQLRKKVQEL